MQRQKDVIGMGEKAKREKWIAEQTKKIKEMTIKGLEPEIQRLVASHKAEVARLQAAFEAQAAATASDRELQVEQAILRHRTVSTCAFLFLES